VYIDTLLVCSATAFVILITGAYNVHGVGDAFLIQNIGAEVASNSPAYTQIAVESVLPGVGKPFIAFALFFFSFTTILAYYYIAETNVAYIQRALKIKSFTFVLKIVLMLATFYGTIKAANLAWGLGDIGVGLMAWLNLVGLLIIFVMGKPAIVALKDYEKQRRTRKEVYTFEPLKLGIKNASFWEKRHKVNNIDVEDDESIGC